MKLMEYVKEKKILTLEEVAEFLSTDVEEVKEFISCGDLAARGARKERVTVMSLARFLEEEIEPVENEERGIDTTGNQRYNPPHSIVIEDLSNEEWEEMKRNGAKELKPYWNESRNKWCIALSLGYDENKKRIRKVITADSQEEVWRKYGEFNFKNTVLPAEVKEAVIENAKHPKAEMLLKDYIEDYLKSKDEDISQRTYEGKMKMAKHIFVGLGSYKMEELNKDILQEFINNIPKKKYKKGENEKHYSKSTINKIYDILHCVIKDATSEEGDNIFKKDIMANIKRPKSNGYKERKEKALSTEQFKKVAEAVKSNEMIYTWVHLMMYTGARPSELLALRFSDINYEEKTINIFRTLTEFKNDDIVKSGTTGKMKADISYLKNDKDNDGDNYQYRTLKVSDKVLDIVKKWEKSVTEDTKLMEMKRTYKKEEYLFCGSKGQFLRYHYYRQAYDRLLQRAGIESINPYRFRHSFCTNALRKGVNIKTVQLMLGDNTAEMVLRVYANMNKDDIFEGCLEVSEVLDRILED
ncbi:integrase [Clostridium beijerinckii]|uniref:tyrosine-type recombinase/integrase n=1 Tax=Clostridium beijerinckii TaxID=1520 RepID=UPI001494CCC9|nr:site-specific integrase [Clostridium beijerinckii]NOW84593.1 integrase [Clostridium beijerinckii]